MDFYCINRMDGANPTTVKLLQKSCKKNGVVFHLVDAKKYNFAKPLRLAPRSILYQLSADETARSIFRTLVRDDIATVFKSTHGALDYKDKVATIIQSREGLPVIKTIFDITQDRALLKDYVTYLGGYPIIIKATGGSHGVGIMRADSFESLISLVDYLKTSVPGKEFFLRQYIDYKNHARLIVLNGQVVDSISYSRVKDDFRSNVGRQLKVAPKKFSSRTETFAIKSVDVLGADFGGVDILIDKAGKEHIAEVNIPCFFARTQLTTGVNVADKLVKFLVEKAKKL